MSKLHVALVALIMSFTALVPGASLANGPTGAPEVPPLVAEDGGLTVTTAGYSVHVRWPTAVQSLAEGGTVFTADVERSGRTGVMSQALKLGDIFTKGFDLVDDRFFVLPETSVDTDGDVVLVLHVERAPLDAGVGEVHGEVRLTFEPSAIRHDYEFHLPSAAFAASVFSTTSLSWDDAFAAHGSLHPDARVVRDDGASLDTYGDWKAYPGPYGVFQETADGTLVGHARVGQGDLVNYLRDGTFRVSPTTSEVRTVFTGFLHYPTIGIDQGLRASDALVFVDTTDPAVYADRLAALGGFGGGGGGNGGEVTFYDPTEIDTTTPTGPTPHVLVGIPDSGINPYHEVYYRPHLDVHPCTYIPGFPCDIPELPLSVGVYDTWADAYAADATLWSGLKQNQWYWIPKTVFVAVMCEGSTAATFNPGACLIDDTNMHGTGTTSSVITENPNALIAFKEGNSATRVFEDGTLPIDIVSYSWGAPVPLALPGVVSRPRDYTPFFVAASGNEGAFPVVLDSPKASHAVINVGAADAATRSEPGYSGWKTADYVSQYCRPTAQTNSIDQWRESYCGTSFSAPTFAGALSKVILELRQQSGYTGSIVNGMVDPILGVSKADVREALNRTATYTPEARFPAVRHAVPLVEAAPAYQWGWGYVDASVVDATLRCILEDECPQKDLATVTYMEALWAFRDAYGGWDFVDAYECAYKDDESACRRMPGQ